MWATGTAAHGFDLYGVGCVPAGAVAGPVVAGTAAGAVAGSADTGPTGGTGAPDGIVSGRVIRGSGPAG
jgi:hypothetical protein